MKRFGITKEKAVIFLLSVIFAFLVSNNIFHIQDIISGSLPVVLIAGLSLIVAYATFQAGLVVIKSLVFVAAELSLILFLAQSYCDVSVVRTESSDNSLMILLVIGLSYVAYRFLWDVYGELKTLAKRFREIDGCWSREAITMFIFLILFVVGFIIMLLEVLTPTVLGLCVYK